MNSLFEVHPWKVIQKGFDANLQLAAESIFSIGNGVFGQRANFEEQYSGITHQGSYVGGVYYPDKTKVGWWKNGYPEFFAKVLNSTNWIGIDIEIDGLLLDLNKLEIIDFYRELDMRNGILYRKVVLQLPGGRKVEVSSKRFCSMAREEVAALSFGIKPINFSAPITLKPYLQGEVYNSDSNYDELFWERVSEDASKQSGQVITRTKKTGFALAVSMRYQWLIQGKAAAIEPQPESTAMYAANTFTANMEQGKTYELQKFVSVVSTMHHEEAKLPHLANQRVAEAQADGFEALEQEHERAWADIWREADIEIEGDDRAQQGIRFNIFQLYQTYTGKHANLNIGPKGFTGEKYGGATYWDTEAYCIPFYLKTADKRIARQLLRYRFEQLDRAIENAQKLGFTNGAALYPMVTMNGEECHNEWEITFEEIHRNGAMVYALYNYVRHTGDTDYLREFGLPVIYAVAKFWAQRFNYSERRKKYVMLGVTGPNEYENNVNNNWYTSYLAKWCLEYASECFEKWGAGMEQYAPTADEVAQWRALASQVYLPQLEESRVFLQQDGFMDKELKSVMELSELDRPINQKWSWDRILRSVYIKQADVLQGIYLFEDHFDRETIEANYAFYEPFTVHESSLSPCVHSILASYLNRMDEAYTFYLRTSRLDLDDYNREVYQGLHITSMAGTVMSVIEGFGGVRITESGMTLRPVIPNAWSSCRFPVRFMEQPLHVTVDSQGCRVDHHGNEAIEMQVYGERVKLMPGDSEFYNRMG